MKVMMMDKTKRINRYVKSGKADKLRTFAAYDKEKSVRLAAIKGLGEIADRESSENALLTLLMDSDSDIRLAAVTALGNTRTVYVEIQLSHYCEKETNEKVLGAARPSLEKIRQAEPIVSLEEDT